MKPTSNKITEEEFKERLVKMFKDDDIKFSDIPKKYREYVAIKVFGRYPLKSFDALEVIKK